MIDREIFRLAVPAFGALIAEPLYVVVDTAVVGHLGTPQLGGLAVAGSLLVGGYSLFVFLAYGTTASVARSLGAGRADRAVHEGIQGIWLALGIGIALALAGSAFSEPLIRVMGASGDTHIHALTYLRISLIGMPAFLVSLAGMGYLRGLQDTRTPLVITIAANLLNLIVEVVLIFGLGYGIGASAMATVLAQWASALAFGVYVIKDVSRSGVSTRPSPVTARSLVRVGFDLFVRTVLLRVVLIVGTAVAARAGVVQLGAYLIAFQVWTFLTFALDSIAIAGQAMIGRLLGARSADGARAAGRRMIELGVWGGIGLALGVVLLRTVLPGIFTADERVMTVAAHLLWYVAALQPISGIAFTLDGILIGAGDSRFLATSMAVAVATFLPVAGIVLWMSAGIGLLWAAFVLFMATRAILLFVRFRGTRWVVLGT